MMTKKKFMRRAARGRVGNTNHGTYLPGARVPVARRPQAQARRTGQLNIMFNDIESKLVSDIVESEQVDDRDAELRAIEVFISADERTRARFADRVLAERAENPKHAATTASVRRCDVRARHRRTFQIHHREIMNQIAASVTETRSAATSGAC